MKKTVPVVMLFGIGMLQVTGCAAPGSKVCPVPMVDEEYQPGQQINRDLIDDHIYFSKEGSSGGRSFGAGGCGCN